MRRSFLHIRSRFALAAACALAAAPVLAASDNAAHPSSKRAFSLPPSAELLYTIKAHQRGLSVNGDAVVQWRAADGKYTIATESRAGMFGKILENKSEGLVDDYGLAPLTYHEKRFRKEPTTTTFQRDGKTIVFSSGDESYPIKGGEQDRTSAPWQLAAIARSAPQKFTPGSEWAFFVAGRRDAEPWVFKVVTHEPVKTGVGEIEAVHLVKAPPKDKPGQQVDLWLAPSLDWYPVRIRFADEDGDDVDQLLVKINKK